MPVLAEALSGGSASTIPDQAAKLVVVLASQAANGSLDVSAKVSATSLALAEGVLKMMTLKKLTVVATVLFSLATVTVGGGLALVRTSGAQDGQPREQQSERTKPASPLEQAPVAAVDELAGKKAEMVRLALERFELQYKRHVVGELPFADVIEACDALENAEVRAENPTRPLVAIKPAAAPTGFRQSKRRRRSFYTQGRELE